MEIARRRAQNGTAVIAVLHDLNLAMRFASRIVLLQLGCGEALHGPGLLLLDEPTSSLDMRHQIDLVETARQRAKNGTAVIAVLHDLNLAMRFADRIVLLHRGRLAIDGGRTDAITAETIRRIFEVDVTVEYTDHGVPFLLPQTMRPVATR